VGFLERDFERDHLAEKSYRTKKGQKLHCELVLDTKILETVELEISSARANSSYMMVKQHRMA
jgi:hypothetical protein